MNAIRLLLVALVVSACSVLPGLPSAPAGPLVTVETRGGECFDGPCGTTVAIEADGRVHAVAPRAAELGMLPPNARAALQEAVRAADFEALASRPFTGECPTAFDGQETIYTFGTPAGPVRLASCEVEIDPAHPLFVAVHAALESLPARDG